MYPTSSPLFLPEIALPSCKNRIQRVKIFYFYIIIFSYIHYKTIYYMHTRSPGFSSSFHFFLPLLSSPNSGLPKLQLTSLQFGKHRKKKMHLWTISTCLASRLIVWLRSGAHPFLGLWMCQCSRVITIRNREWDLLSPTCGSQVHFMSRRVGSSLHKSHVPRIRRKSFPKEKSRCCSLKEVVNLGPLPKLTSVHYIDYVLWI